MFFITIKVFIRGEIAELLKLELAEIGFDSFWEEEEGSFLTSIAEENFSKSDTEAILGKYKDLTDIHYEFEKAAKQNWNQLWEESYSPVFVGDECVIRADFHQLPRSFKYDILIHPKMSFGTGHHETTALCVEQLINMDLAGKKVADIGCGTGILSIMALKKGAKHITACDVEEWAVENAQENMQLNGFPATDLTIFQGTVAQISATDFDTILANINLNILLAEIHIYSKLLAKNGSLLLSGFYVHEANLIAAEAGKYGLQLKTQLAKNNWTALLFGRI
jgi:ribosomal protein L11 methyltransferase